eukprot:PITA_17740
MYGYAGGVSAFIATVVILGHKHVEPPSEFAIIRITETFIGIGCYILMELILQPRRASTLARKELVITLCSLHDFTSSIIAAQTSQGFVHSHVLTLLELKEKERTLESHVGRLRNYIEEAKVEPDFWFLPFPATIYSKLLDSYCKIADLLHFATLSYESIIKSCASNNLSVNRIYGFLNDDLQMFENKVTQVFQCIAEVLRVKSLGKLIMQNHNEDNRSQYLQSSDQDITGSLIKSVQEAVTDILSLAEEDEINTGNDFVISLSALAFCLEDIIIESREIEKAIHELLQWENPWSFIGLWMIYQRINSYKPNLT